MSETFIENARRRIAEAKDKHAEALALIARLEKAGENTSELRRRATELEYKIRQYESAFAD